MDSESIKRIVEVQTKDRLDEPHAHGIYLRKCLLTPALVTLIARTPTGDKPFRAWLVLAENPKRQSGYRIVGDEDGSRFGLATDGLIFLGWRGDFLTTLEGMSSRRRVGVLCYLDSLADGHHPGHRDRLSSTR